MKKIVLLMGSLLIVAAIASADIKIVTVKGDVRIRRGVTEQWVAATKGDVLKPEDSMKSGKKSSAVILIDGKEKVTVPELVIIDCSDFRRLTSDQLMLMLAMETVRLVPAGQHEGDVTIPRTTTIHGESQESLSAQAPARSSAGQMQLNGTKVLYDKGFFATCVLKAKEVFRLNPELMNMIDMRLMVANAFERMKLNGEALSEYRSLTNRKLSPEQHSIVDTKIGQLKRNSD